MTQFLALEPLEFLLRYNVIAGMVVAIIGTAICMMAKRITMAKKGQVEIDKNDSTYVKIKYLGIGLVIVGMILIALPFEASLYRG